MDEIRARISTISDPRHASYIKHQLSDILLIIMCGVLSGLDTLGDLGQYRTNELVRWRMHFLSDAIAEIEGLLEVNRDFCKKQMAEKASPALPTNCAVLP